MVAAHRSLLGLVVCVGCIKQLGVCSAPAPAIHVVDLGESDVAHKLDESFRATGFAVITGHGVSRDVLSEFHQRGLEFFHQPLEVKQRYNNGKGYGFGGYLHQEEAAAQLLGDFGKPNDWVESLTFPGGLPRLSDDASMPALSPDFQRAADGMLNSMARLRSHLDGLVCQALGVDPADLLSRVDHLSAGIRLAFYPAQSGAMESGRLRYGAHVDSGGLTMLMRDEAAPWGTQVQLGGGGWLDVPIVNESIVLNVGALMSRATNGRWRASVHRVANSREERLSIVSGSMVFRADVEVAPLDSCVSPDSPLRYEPVVAGEFLRERVRLHRDSYAEEQGYSKAEAEQVFGDMIRDYQM